MPQQLQLISNSKKFVVLPICVVYFAIKVACMVQVAFLKEWNNQFFTFFLSEFLQDAFDILKLNYHTWKKVWH